MVGLVILGAKCFRGHENLKNDEVHDVTRGQFGDNIADRRARRGHPSLAKAKAPARLFHVTQQYQYW